MDSASGQTPEAKPGDVYLARLLARPALRAMLYIVFTSTALASLYLRVIAGNAIQILPWYGVLLSLYGFATMFRASDFRCRVVYASFGALVAATFSRGVLSDHTRTVGGVEVVASLLILAGLVSLSRDPKFMALAVLQSPPTPNPRSVESSEEPHAIQEDQRVHNGAAGPGGDRCGAVGGAGRGGEGEEGRR